MNFFAGNEALRVSHRRLRSAVVSPVIQGAHLSGRIDGDDPPQLLILDLEIPYLDEPEVWARLKDRQPPLPVVIHTFLPEYPTNLTLPIAASFLEKKGDTDQLKAVVAEVIDKHYPGGVPAREQTG